MHDHRDVLHAAALGRSRETVARGGGVAGLESRAAGVPVDKLVGIGKVKAAAADRIHPDGGVLLDSLVADELTGHDGHVPRGGVVLPVVKEPGAVGKVRVPEAQRLCPVVHLFDEGLLAAA